MKRIYLTLAAIMALSVSCGAQGTKSNGGGEGSTIAITKDDFVKRVANIDLDASEWRYLGDKPALVDFYASWCGPCKMIAPILEELAVEYNDEIVIYKVNIDAEPELAAAFGVRSIPTLLFVPMTDQPQMSKGAMSKEQFKAAIDEVLLKKKK